MLDAALVLGNPLRLQTLKLYGNSNLHGKLPYGPLPTSLYLYVSMPD